MKRGGIVGIVTLMAGCGAVQPYNPAPIRVVPDQACYQQCQQVYYACKAGGPNSAYNLAGAIGYSLGSGCGPQWGACERACPERFSVPHAVRPVSFRLGTGAAGHIAEEKYIFTAGQDIQAVSNEVPCEGTCEIAYVLMTPDGTPVAGAGLRITGNQVTHATVPGTIVPPGVYVLFLARDLESLGWQNLHVVP